MSPSGFHLMSRTGSKLSASGQTVSPIPSTMGYDGCQCNTSKHFLYAAGFVLGGAAIGYFSGEVAGTVLWSTGAANYGAEDGKAGSTKYMRRIGYKFALRGARVNSKVQLANDKVVDTVDVEDIGEKKAFCRCWKSEKFPYCDGAHTKHNNETGDNVGPLVVKGRR